MLAAMLVQSKVFFRKPCLLLNSPFGASGAMMRSFIQMLEVLSQNSGIGPEFPLRALNALSKWSDLVKPLSHPQSPERGTSHLFS